MNVTTTRFGEIRIEPDQIVEMPAGMPGFPDSRRFALWPHKADSPFWWFQSLEDAALAFVLTNPLYFLPDYHLDLDSILRALSWDDTPLCDIDLFVVVNVPNGTPERMTANLIGPLLVDRSTRQAVQVVLPDSPYSHCHRLLAES